MNYIRECAIIIHIILGRRCFMRRLLMNKNIEILAAEYDTANGVFLKVLDVYNLIS